MKNFLVVLVIWLSLLGKTLWECIYTVIGMSVFLVWFSYASIFWLIPMFGLALDLIRAIRYIKGLNESNNSSTGIE